MNCECVEKVNKKLADAGHKYKLSMSLVFDSKMDVECRLAIETCWVDQTKRGKKPPSMLCTFCPFCGKRAAKPDIRFVKDEVAQIEDRKG